MPAHNAKYSAPVVGATYGDRVVISAESRSAAHHTQWFVRCVCGDEAWVGARELVTGEKQSCRPCMERRFVEAAAAAKRGTGNPRVVPHAPRVRGRQLHALQRLVDWIARQPRPVRIAEIVGRFGNSAVTVQRLLVQGEKLGCLERVPASLTSPEMWRAPVPVSAPASTPSEGVAA